MQQKKTDHCIFPEEAAQRECDPHRIQKKKKQNYNSDKENRSQHLRSNYLPSSASLDLLESTNKQTKNTKEKEKIHTWFWMP